jgi:hypothetical protein
MMEASCGLTSGTQLTTMAYTVGVVEWQDGMFVVGGVS